MFWLGASVDKVTDFEYDCICEIVDFAILYLVNSSDFVNLFDTEKFLDLVNSFDLVYFEDTVKVLDLVNSSDFVNLFNA